MLAAASDHRHLDRHKPTIRRDNGAVPAGVSMTALRTVFLRVVVASLSVTAVVAIVALLVGDFGETEGRILLTTASIAFFSLLSLPAGVLLDQGRLAPIAWAVFGLSAAGLLLALEIVWVEWDDPRDAVWKALVVVAAFDAALAQIAATQSRRVPSDPAWVIRLAQLSAASGLLLAALISLAALLEIDHDGYYRALAAVAVATVLFALLQPILRRTATPQTAGDTFRLVCVLDGPPDRLPGESYRERGGVSTEIECELAARDFAAAAATAIRELERSGARVTRLERA